MGFISLKKTYALYQSIGLFLAESVRFELTVGRPITSFQDWLLKPLGQLSIGDDDTTLPLKSQVCHPRDFFSQNPFFPLTNHLYHARILR